MNKEHYIIKISEFQNKMVHFQGDEEALDAFLGIIDFSNDYIHDDIRVLKMIYDEIEKFRKEWKKQLKEGGVQ